MSKPAKVLVIGGGFFGCRIALQLRRYQGEVVLVERESELLRRASYNNQARIHHGYHYARSILTAIRSRINFARFVNEYPECVDQTFEKVYAIGRRFSHVTAAQFRAFCERIGAPLEPASSTVRALFRREMIEEVFHAQEYAFDAVKLRDRMQEELLAAGVDFHLGTAATRVSAAPGGGLDVELAGPCGASRIRARHVFNSTYSGLNALLQASGLPLLSLKHEATEMALVKPPAELAGLGVTVMCGPFFSIMPFPPRGLHSLSHVRYTPHYEWHEREGGDAPRPAVLAGLRSNHDRMVRDAARYLPCIADAVYTDSLWEVKTVLPASEQDDSRPILFKANCGLPRLTCIMGGKIDNVYDVAQEIDQFYAQGGLN